MFKECYALEKIHGTSAHVRFRRPDFVEAGLEATGMKTVSYFSGGASHDSFVSLFDEAAIFAKFMATGAAEAIVYGEAYGGKCQGMSETYGKDLKFIVFDVKIGEFWLSVPDMEKFAKGIGFEVVHYEKIPVDLAVFDAQRDADSIQAIRNGIGQGKHREGVVLRPLIELTKNNGERIMVKHKRESFEERATPQKVIDPAKLLVLGEAKAIADEWVTEMRLTHVLDKLPQGINMESTQDVIKAMIEDVFREAKGEIIESKEARTAIGKKTAEMFKNRIKSSLYKT
jgi:hypothetical protein